MNIVIYGCDNAGKTSLAEFLEKDLRRFLSDINIKQIHSLGNVPLDDQINFMKSELLDKTSKDIKIFDRFPIIEEEVYGNILRGSSKYSYQPVITNVMLDKVDLFIYAYPGLLSTLRWNGREQMDGVIDNVVKIINAYNNLTYEFITEGRNVIEFNYNVDPDYEDIVSKVLEMAHEYNN